MYKYFNNHIVNSFYEARLPSNYQKPGPNASNNEVEQFIRDKYLNRRWVNPKIETDPVTLYKTNMEKFKKYIKNDASGVSNENG